jgi:2-oxoglutarate dehydrogenase E2 component (dihydrolipoamide succinyltransferase)
VAARQQTAMLTTFNEIDMQRLQALRERYRKRFEERYGVGLGLVSFFVTAAVEALREFPQVNAFIDGGDMVYHEHMDIGVAIGADKGLVVPVLKNAEALHLWEVEKGIATFVENIRKNRLELSDLEGGTFTITNGGVFGSLLSTPLLNFPQSAILGMHAIQDRPVVRDGAIVIRPMMYVALSYDHRVIDGREAVRFLKRIKEQIEDPERILLEV